MVAKGDFTRP